MFLWNGVIEEKGLIERRADRRKARLIHRAAILRRQLRVFVVAAAPCGGNIREGSFHCKTSIHKRKTSGQKVPRSLFKIRFLFGFAQLRRLLGFPVIQQRNDLVFHFPRGLVLAEILFQFRTIDDHLVYLLFLL